MAGIGYVLRKGEGMTIGLKYYDGFTNVIKGVACSNNRVWFFKVNIPIGRNKKEDLKKANG